MEPVRFNALAKNDSSISKPAEEVSGMSKISELLALAEACFVQAGGTVDPLTKRALQEMGDQYLGEANRHWIIEANSALA